MRSVLLGTTFLIDLMNGDEGAIEKAQELERDLVQQRLSAMTLFDLYYGVARSNQSEVEREKVENVLSSKPIHPAVTAVMGKAGRLAGELANAGPRSATVTSSWGRRPTSSTNRCSRGTSPISNGWTASRSIPIEQ